MKTIIAMTIATLSFLTTAQASSNCLVKIDQDNFNFAFGQEGINRAKKILAKKGYTITTSGDTEFLLTGARPFSNSIWDMWSPITPSWYLKVRENGEFTTLKSGYIQGRLFFDSEKRRARKLRRELKKELPVCQVQ